jgi:hypothetical protein
VRRGLHENATLNLFSCEKQGANGAPLRMSILAGCSSCGVGYLMARKWTHVRRKLVAAVLIPSPQRKNHALDATVHSLFIDVCRRL